MKIVLHEHDDGLDGTQNVAGIAFLLFAVETVAVIASQENAAVFHGDDIGEILKRWKPLSGS